MHLITYFLLLGLCTATSTGTWWLAWAGCSVLGFDGTHVGLAVGDAEALTSFCWFVWVAEMSQQWADDSGIPLLGVAFELGLFPHVTRADGLLQLWQ